MKHKETLGHKVKTLENLFYRNLITYEISRKRMDEVTVMHGWILGFLYENQDRDIFQKDIESECSIARSTVTCIVKLMEKKGYIRRESVEQDARLKKLVLTENGRKVHLIHMNDTDILEERCQRGIPKEDIETFRTVAEKLKKNLEEDIASNKKSERKEET